MTATGTVATVQPSAPLAIRPGQEMWTDKQRAALSVLGIRNATNADLAVFMHYCQKTGLDPFSRQIYMICRREKQGDQWVDKQTIQVGIDGFRVIRDRIASRLGVTVEYEDTVWYDADGSAHKAWLWEHAPAACAVTVIKDGRRFPGVVRTASYMATNKNGDPVSQWKTQPDHMIEKCAEAFALRRAFPHDLGGIYLDDEMPAAEPGPARQARVTVAEITGKPERPPAAGQQPAGPARQPDAAPPWQAADSDAAGSASKAQLTRLGSVFTNLGFTAAERDQRLAIAEQIIGRTLAGPKAERSTSNLSAAEASKLTDTLGQCGSRDDLIAMLAAGSAAEQAAGQQAPDSPDADTQETLGGDWPAPAEPGPGENP